ncbi:Hypothetical protein SRAE_2000349000 [Strongyloides ratti]|uniref:Uncharacterized protein n=1 Tax=Strongyloides ratti TaxID=34506 RepID=A0A090LMT7_STRRB|nr:Hypothetical protein SRAE_2000349000 [Strongyloides ratti]CEF68835.1 Hypothetical protein SRAE_2000349000 [Strongyloides ratti]
MIWSITLAQWPSWDPEIVVINKPTVTENNGVYKRIRYGYYTFPSNTQPNTWNPSPPSPPPSPWPPYPPPRPSTWPPSWYSSWSSNPSSNWQ